MTDQRDSELALRHPLRVALLELLREVGSLTSNDAARRLGESSGACSFHLRQLARYGFIEQAGDGPGRARPWRLASQPDRTSPDGDRDGEIGPLARELEDEGYRRWLALRDQAPPRWRADEAFSSVLYLTPEELTTVAAAVREVLAPLRERESDPTRRPADAAPVAFVARLFPLLPTVPEAGPTGERPERDTARDR